VTQPGGSAQFVGKVEVEFEKNEKWEVKTMKAAMLSAAGYAPDPRISELIANVESETQMFLDRTIGVVPDDDLRITDPFLARRYKHKIVTLINLVQLKASQAQISCTSLGNDVTGFDKTITIRNILSTYVYPNTLVVVKITGKTLREALEKNAEYFAIDDGRIVVNPKFCFPKPEHYNYDMFDGIDYVFDISQPIGSRVVKLSRAGQNILPDQEFSLVMNNYRATGGGDFHMYRGLPVLKEISTDIAELLINYIREQKEIKVPDPKNIEVVLNGK
jgi:2',3'-cyclic-nucleotide 2'-phosphodiesterase/3'-nucleotidase